MGIAVGSGCGYAIVYIFIYVYIHTVAMRTLVTGDTHVLFGSQFLSRQIAYDAFLGLQPGHSVEGGRILVCFILVCLVLRADDMD